MPEVYLYIIDLDERGTFRAHVDNLETGETVFEINTDEDEGENWMIDAGYMKNNNDLGGLEAYLIEMDIIPSGSILTDSESEAEELLNDEESE